MGGFFLTWDAVALTSIAMVIIAIGIVIFLGFKIVELMKRDAETNKGEKS
ncbi:hypothetical protein [Thiorhodococcus minor]|nr:hypothetical protein [Thiorhodococcus minor]